jgi:release factor glutamine methyltransferase
LSEPTARIEPDTLGKILQAILPVPEGAYSPSEDSFLILDAISTIPIEGNKVLDVGTGSGILGLFCALRGASVTITDIDQVSLLHAQEAAKILGVHLEVTLSDLFSNVDGQFDLILFNPPYLTSTTLEDRTVDGGKKGAETAMRFLENLQKHLKPEGSALLLVSSQNDPSSLTDQHPEFDFSTVARRALFFEELQVLCVRLHRDVAR